MSHFPFAPISSGSHMSCPPKFLPTFVTLSQYQLQEFCPESPGGTQANSGSSSVPPITQLYLPILQQLIQQPAAAFPSCNVGLCSPSPALSRSSPPPFLLIHPFTRAPNSSENPKNQPASQAQQRNKQASKTGRELQILTPLPLLYIECPSLQPSSISDLLL